MYKFYFIFLFFIFIVIAMLASLLVFHKQMSLLVL